MRVFIYEHTCAAEMEPSAISLRTEGWAMLAAILEDFSRLPGVESVTLLRDPSLRVPSGVEIRLAGADDETCFRDLAARADYSLVIAPEFADILTTRCRWVEESGGRLLGPSSAAVAVTADKFALASLFERHGIPTPPCLLVTAGQVRAPETVPYSFPLVSKPRHGAGSQSTFLLHSPQDLPRCVAEADDVVLQPFVPGQAASVAFLIGPGRCLPLLPATQILSRDGRFRYEGGEVPLPAELAWRAIELGRRAVAVVPGLRGYVGVDLVLGKACDGSQDQVLEINPRLTTSYVGLRTLAVTNLAEAMWHVAVGEEIGEVMWRSGSVWFWPDGRVKVCEQEQRAASLYWTEP
jgi:predicted ATP-grasp superfamily ATP-dependent carboligase